MNDDESDPDPFLIRLAALRDKATRVKVCATDAAAKAGYIEAATNQFATAWQAIGRASRRDATVVPFLASGEAVARELDQQLDGLTVQAGTFADYIDLSLPVFSTASSSSVVACNSIAVIPALHFQPCPFLPDSDERSYASKLQQFSATLADTYRGAWASHFDQVHDEGRTALWQMRQVFDHFFELLAPDEAVRSSEHWAPKAPPKPDAVHRRERLVFAAHQWIPAHLRTTFVESVSSALQAYERLNSAHARDVLDRDRWHEAFLAVDAIIRRWVDSVDTWPPQARPSG